MLNFFAAISVHGIGEQAMKETLEFGSLWNPDPYHAIVYTDATEGSRPTLRDLKKYLPAALRKQDLHPKP